MTGWEACQRFQEITDLAYRCVFVREYYNYAVERRAKDADWRRFLDLWRDWCEAQRVKWERLRAEDPDLVAYVESYRRIIDELERRPIA